MNGEETKKDKNISYIKNPSKNYEQEDHKQKRMFEQINQNLESIKKEINNVIITDQSGISDQLSYFTPVKLRQERFSPEIINKLNYSFIGKSLEEGRISFFRELAKKLSSNDFSRMLSSRNIFVFGNSGSGKSTLSAKIASFLSDKKQTKNINFIDVSNTSTALATSSARPGRPLSGDSSVSIFSVESISV